MLEGIVLADEARLLLGLEVVEEDVALLGLLTPVLDDDARAVDDLAGVALAVNLACSQIIRTQLPYRQSQDVASETYKDQPIHQAACHRAP